MSDLYLFALSNFLLCMSVAAISFCRINAMEGPILYRVRSEYAGYLGGALTSAFQPYWGEWPQWGSVSIAACLLVGLLCSRHAWRSGPPSSATGPAPLSEQ
jgi:hypothetical protein